MTISRGILGLPLCLLSLFCNTNPTRKRGRNRRLPRLRVGLVCALAMAGNLAGQQSPRESEASPSGGKLPAQQEKSVTFKGEAKVSTHPYKMQKGDAYRISVKADGFTPQVRVDGGGSAPINLPAFNTQKSFQDPKTPLGPRRDAQILFMPKETKVYQIMVDHAVGTEIGKGPHAYTLTIERAAFTPQATFKDGRLGIGDDTKRMVKGMAYNITVMGRGFAPKIQIMDGSRSVMTSMAGRWFGFGPDAEYVGSFMFIPPRTADYRILLGLGPMAEKRIVAPKYSTTIVELKLELSAKDQLTNVDPIYPARGSRHKIHSVKLQAGKNYQIDMVSGFDNYLFLEDAKGNILMEDDDSGGYPNARIIFRPSKTDTYRIVATSFAKAMPNDFLGPYTLTVVENPDARPVPPLTSKEFPKFKK